VCVIPCAHAHMTLPLFHSSLFYVTGNDGGTSRDAERRRYSLRAILRTGLLSLLPIPRIIGSAGVPVTYELRIRQYVSYISTSCDSIFSFRGVFRRAWVYVLVLKAYNGIG
jgi:hypothetical protein